MIIQWILQILAVALVGCVIGFFLIRIFNKLRVFLFRKRGNKTIKELEVARKEEFYNQFGFYYEDVIKYAPELDAFLSSKLPQRLADSVKIKMLDLETIYNAIDILEQVDIIKFKQTIENIKNQKSLENID